MGWLQDVGNQVTSGANQWGNGWAQVAQGNVGQGLGDVFNGTVNMTGAPINATLGNQNTILNNGGYGSLLPGASGSGASGGASTDPYAGMPQYPTFTNPWNQSMSEVPAYEQEVQAGSSALNAMDANATDAAASPWAQAAEAQNQNQVNNALNKGAQSVQGQEDTQNASEAMQGGLSEGAKERGAEAANTGYMNMAQGVQNQGLSNNLGIQTQDEANKLNQLNQVNNTQQQQVQGYMTAKNADTANQMGATQAQNQFNMGNYQTQAGIWGAGQTANAISNSGSTSPLGCFITTAMCDHFGLPDNCEQLAVLRKFRDEVLAPDPMMRKDLGEYYFLSTKIDKTLRSIKSDDVWDVIKAHVDRAVAQVKAGKDSDAYLTYKKLVGFVTKVVGHA